MTTSLPLALLVQLPIPPPGPQPIQGNVPLAAAYLKLFAQRSGLQGWQSKSYRMFPVQKGWSPLRHIYQIRRDGDYFFATCASDNSAVFRASFACFWFVPRRRMRVRRQ